MRESNTGTSPTLGSLSRTIFAIERRSHPASSSETSELQEAKVNLPMSTTCIDSDGADGGVTEPRVSGTLSSSSDGTGTDTGVVGWIFFRLPRPEAAEAQSFSTRAWRLTRCEPALAFSSSRVPGGSGGPSTPGVTHAWRELPAKVSEWRPRPPQPPKPTPEVPVFIRAEAGAFPLPEGDLPPAETCLRRMCVRSGVSFLLRRCLLLLKLVLPRLRLLGLLPPGV